MTRRLVLAALLALLAAVGAGAEWSSGGDSEVALEGDGHHWQVRATLNGNVSGDFLLDTGASLCVLGPDTARRLGVEPSGRHATIHTANGPIRAPIVTVRTLDVGGNRARDVLAVVHPAVPPPLDGVIGLSYLNNFKYGVDPRRRVLRLQ